MGEFVDFIQESYLLDVLDVLIVALLFYRLYLLIRGTRATEMFFGLAILFVFSLVAQNAGLLLLNRIIGGLQTVWLIAFIILFQQELRGALSYLGKTRYFRFFTKHKTTPVVDDLVQAIGRIQRAGLGAILVIERHTGLKNHIETGTRLDAIISPELLETIFTPPTPLHDGAAILHGNRVVAAGCILPLSRNEQLAYTLGTRHRAALGLTEESDAFVVVISEESRQVSVAAEGRLRRQLSPDDLRSELQRVLKEQEESGLTSATKNESAQTGV